MKNWPADDTETVYFSDLTKSVADVIRFGYEMKRRNRNKNIPYNGYNTDMEEHAGDFDPVIKLKAKKLKYAEEDQGRDLLIEAIGIAVQLGIAQGRRIQRERMKVGMKLMESAIKHSDVDKSNKERLISYFDILKHSYTSLQKISRKKV
jgi:hypothetical protein